MKVLDFLSNGFFFPLPGQDSVFTKLFLALLNVIAYVALLYYAAKGAKAIFNSDVFRPVRSLFSKAGKLSAFAQDSARKARAYGRAA